MPKQHGLVNISGTIGEFEYYRLDGKGYMRKSSSKAARERARNSPKYQRFRDNYAEFKGQALAASLFTKGLKLVLGDVSRRLHHRLRALMRSICKASAGESGKRPVAVSGKKELLTRFAIHEGASLDSVLKADITSTPSASRASASLQVVGDDAAKMIKAPPAATHFRLVHGLAVMSDVIFDPGLNLWKPVTPGMEKVHKVTSTDYLPLKGADPLALSLETALPVEALPDTTTVIETLGIEFFALENDAYAPIFDSRATAIVNVF